jgi:hypothetical protein
MNILTSFELGLIVGGVGGVLLPLLGYACLALLSSLTAASVDDSTNSTPTGPTVTATDATSTPTGPTVTATDATSTPTGPINPATRSNESPIRSKIVCLTIESMSDAAIDDCIDAFLNQTNHQPTSMQLEESLLNTVYGTKVVQEYLTKHNDKLQHWVRQRLKVLHETGAKHRKAILNPYNNDVNLFTQSLQETARKMMVDQATHVQNVLRTKKPQPQPQPQPQPLQDQNQDQEQQLQPVEQISRLPDEILRLICTWLGTKHGSRFSASLLHVARVFQPVVNKVVDPFLDCFESVFETENDSLVRMVFSSFRILKRNTNVETRLSVTRTGALNQSRWWECRKLATNIILGELELATEKIQQFGVGFGIGFDSITEQLDVGSEHWVDEGKHPGYVCPTFATESGKEFPAIQELIQLDCSQAKELIWCPSALLFFRSGRFKLLKTESEQKLITNSQIDMLNLLIKEGLDVHREKTIAWKFFASALAPANFPTFQKKDHCNGSLLSLAVQKLDVRA